MLSTAPCLVERFPWAPGTGHAVTVRLRRPERANALDLPLLDGIVGIFRSAEVRDARLCFFEGEGNVFSAGLDLDWLETLRNASRGDRERAGQALADVLDAVAALDAPVVGYAGRGAFGAGVAVLVAADWIVADPTARFRLSEARLGISGGILLKTLRPKVPEAALRRWVLTAQEFDAADARASGLVADFCTAAAWPEKKTAIAGAVALGAPAVTATFKRALRMPCPTTTDGRLLADALESADGEEGLRAFRERRAPQWKARHRSSP